MLSFDNSGEVITCQIEHHAILRSTEMLKRLGYPVHYLPVDSQGIVQPDILRYHISNRTKLVSVMLSNNEVGTVEPVKELADIAHEYHALFHTDAVQSVGHIPIDVKDLNIDMLSASAHKFNGPKGIGFLYVKKGVQIYPFNDGGAQEFGMRAGTENIASIVGMATALKLNCDKISAHTEHLNRLETLLLDKLNAANIDYRRNGATKHVPGNISLSFKGAQGEMLLHRLDLSGICISTGSACDSRNTQVSHVLRAMKVPEEYALGTIRISLGKENTEEDIERIANVLIKTLKLIQ